MGTLRCLFIVLALAGCGSGNTTPTTPTPSPSPVPTPAPTPTPNPTPVPAPAPAGPSFTVRGVVRDGMDSSALPGVTITLAPIGLCGHTVPGLVTTATVTDAQGRYSIVEDTTPLFHVVGGAEGQARFVRTGFDELCGVLLVRGANATVNATLPRAGCHTFPDVPNPMVTRGADFIEFSWTPIAGARDYVVNVGPIAGGFDSTDTAFRTPTALQTTTGGVARYRWNTPNLAPGEYWVGVSAKADCGIGGFINIPLRFTYP